VCLLHTLVELAPRWDFQLSVLHLNHKLRGEDSERDEEFVRAMAARLGLPVTVRAWQRPPESALPESANLEEAARQARLAFFAETIASGAVDCVALGHTRSDQAETVLFRFLRGAGTAGLAGIRPVTSTGLIRPLLIVTRSQVKAFLKERGISWREDLTNASPRFARNRIRHALLPQLAAEWNPAIAETLADTAEWALAEEAYWDAEIGRLESALIVETPGAALIRGEDLRGLPVALARRLIRRAIERVKGDLRGIEFRHVAAALELADSAEGHGRLQAPGVDVLRSLDWVRLGVPGSLAPERRRYRFPAPVPGRLEIPDSGGWIRLELTEKSGSADRVYDKGTDWLEWRKLSGPLVVRNWNPGDQYQPVGKSGEVKIKTLFQEARIPLWERGRWPVLLDGSSVVWARRFGAAVRAAPGPGAQTILVIQDTGPGGPAH
jgi:tRNA(Ile)-lysidine synthase